MWIFSLIRSIFFFFIIGKSKENGVDFVLWFEMVNFNLFDGFIN